MPLSFLTRNRLLTTIVKPVDLCAGFAIMLRDRRSVTESAERHITNRIFTSRIT